MTSAPNDKCHNFCQILKMANRYLKLAKERKPFSSKQYRNQSVQCNTPQTNIKIFRSTWGDKDSRVLTWALLGSVSGPFPVELTKAFSLIELTLTANFYCCCCLGQPSFHSMFFGLYNHVHFFKIFHFFRWFLFLVFFLLLCYLYIEQLLTKVRWDRLTVFSQYTTGCDMFALCYFCYCLNVKQDISKVWNKMFS